jgi:hypothetical protein
MQQEFTLSDHGMKETSFGIPLYREFAQRQDPDTRHELLATARMPFHPLMGGQGMNAPENRAKALTKATEPKRAAKTQDFSAEEPEIPQA